jgi:hypothetical protein
MTLTEERPDYPARVAAYLAKHWLRRLPWGAIVVAGGGLTYTHSVAERAARAEVGEVAIAVLGALGVTTEMLDKLADLPHDTAPAALVEALERLRNAPSVSESLTGPVPAGGSE